jgi:hypothetical protein
MGRLLAGKSALVTGGASGIGPVTSSPCQAIGPASAAAICSSTATSASEASPIRAANLHLRNSVRFHLNG